MHLSLLFQLHEPAASLFCCSWSECIIHVPSDHSALSKTVYPVCEFPNSANPFSTEKSTSSRPSLKKNPLVFIRPTGCRSTNEKHLDLLPCNMKN